MENKLTNEEVLRIREIVNDYRNAEQELDSIEDAIANLFTRKDFIVRRLDEIRSTENVLMEELASKHGEGTLDPLTMTYVTKNCEEI